MSDEATAVARTFPFLMVLASVFLGGVTFLLTCFPLVFALITNSHGGAVDLPRVISSIIRPYWESLGQHLTIGSSVLLGIAALLTGFLVQKLTALNAEIWGYLLSKQRHSSGYFRPTVYRNPKYAEFSARLHQHKELKQDWEWQLFRWWVDWSIATNAFLFVILTFIVEQRLELWLLLPGFVWIGSLVFALQASRFMDATHDYAWKQVLTNCERLSGS